MPEVNFQQPINSAARIVEEYMMGKRDFERAELGDANLQSLDLKGSDFSYADLSRANLGGANLRGCDLSFADLSEANLQNADLRGAMLFSANLRQANLEGTHLKKADCDHNTHFPKNFDPIAAGVSMSEL
ncbi:pentapeptide repeat-containing protein [Aphanizomenon sp. PH219]|uniref:pentapeptide repeat-containing protein n=1 Tax=Aphanizomenon flos-aquae TaxID=1176 RepID=UPI0004871FFC|nr:pentapeptide repeat-containing protein [Aphanizomenon flos-aquae]MDK2409494.1 pentapeptide repeat-containing protein [Aphanizomenon sp. 202]MDK2460073.1 pentapeptide repeat-containing protein [Aphanizomenon sp. PH219]